MFLVDTNVFLEILLSQEKEETCKSFLDDNIGKLHVTDFSLHSIGVIPFRYDKRVCSGSSRKTSRQTSHRFPCPWGFTNRL